MERNSSKDFFILPEGASDSSANFGRRRTNAGSSISLRSEAVVTLALE